MSQDYATVSGEKVHRSDFAYAPEGSEPSEWKLPIHDASHVRNALARFNQTELPETSKAEVHAKIMRAAKKFGVDDGKTASDAPRLVFQLSDRVPASGRIKLPIAVTGEWVKDGKKFSITLSHLKQMISNFAKRKNGEVNVDYEHASEKPEVAKGDLVPSAGPLVAMSEPESYVDPQGAKRHILYGEFEPTDKARAAIRSREVRYTSPAISWHGENKENGDDQGATLTTIALTNRPFLEELPQVHLSDPGFKLMDAQSVHVDSNLSSAATAGKEKSMKKYKVKKLADGEHKGKHGIFDDGGEMVGLAEIEPDAEEKKEETEKASEALLTEIGATSAADAKVLIERGRKVNVESALLSEVVTEKGKIDTMKLDELVDSGKVKPSATRRALEAESKVQSAFNAGKIHPAQLQRALRLCLSDPEAFGAFIADRPATPDLTVQGAYRAAEGGSAATLLLTEMIEKRMKENGESHDVAELNVIRTSKGLALWEQSRNEQIETRR